MMRRPQGTNLHPKPLVGWLENGGLTASPHGLVTCPTHRQWRRFMVNEACPLYFGIPWFFSTSACSKWSSLFRCSRLAVGLILWRERLGKRKRKREEHRGRRGKERERPNGLLEFPPTIMAGRTQRRERKVSLSPMLTGHGGQSDLF